jgi:hypothetical protein
LQKLAFVAGGTGGSGNARDALQKFSPYIAFEANVKSIGKPFFGMTIENHFFAKPISQMIPKAVPQTE